MIKEKALTLPDLDRIWDAQAGKHEAIVKNVHDLLAKLAWDFSPEQLDHLFECFQVRTGLNGHAMLELFNTYCDFWSTIFRSIGSMYPRRLISGDSNYALWPIFLSLARNILYN